MNETGEKQFKHDPRTWEKFDRRGNALRHRGSTFVSHVVPDSDIYNLGKRIIDDLTEAGLHHEYAILPACSYHMTVLEGIKDRKWIGQAEKWPAWVGEYKDFSEVVVKQLQRLITANVKAPASMNMVITGMKPLGESLTINLNPADAQTATELARFRREICEVLELPYPEPDTYKFHMSLGYRLTEVGETATVLDGLRQKYEGWAKDIQVVDLEPVAFNILDDMLAFPPLLFFAEK